MLAFQQESLLPQLTRFPGKRQPPELLEKRLTDFVYKLHSYQQIWEGGVKSQCSGLRDQQGIGDQDSMSQRPSASRPASRSPHDDHRVALPAVQYGDNDRPGGLQVEQRGGQDVHVTTALQRSGQTLPALQTRGEQIGPSDDERRSAGPSRDSGLRSILNPTEPEVSDDARRRSTTTAESPQSVVSSSQFGASPASQHALPSLQPARTSPIGYTSVPYPQRRVLTPRSPRVASLGRGSGTIDAHQSPFLHGRSRAYTTEPVQTRDPAPTPPAKTQQQYGFPSTSTPTEHIRRHSGGRSAQGRTPVLETVSPSVSASSQNLSSQTSPTSYGYPASTQPPVSGSYFPGSYGQQGSGGAPAVSEGPYSATPTQTAAPSFPTSSTAVSGGDGSRQSSVTRDPMAMMTISTSQGLIHVPVDTHQASRLADEKRARNAGASARFRQRRKDKEREANTNIEKLQQQTRELQGRLRETETERDFYRGERDRFREAVSRTPGLRETMIQAPPSPHAMSTMRSGSFGAPPGGPPLSFDPPEPTMERPPRRQRTNTQGDFQTLSYSLPPAPTTLPPVPSHLGGFPPTHMSSQNLPPLRIENPASATSSSASTGGSTTQPSSTGPSSAGPQPAPYDPAYHRGAYDRTWPREGGNRRRS